MDRRSEAGFFREHELHPRRTLRRYGHDRYRFRDAGDISYRAQKLQIAATTTASDATLTAYVTSTNALIGTLTKQSDRFIGKFSWPTNPVNVTVKSSAGGMASKSVVTR